MGGGDNTGGAAAAAGTKLLSIFQRFFQGPSCQLLWHCSHITSQTIHSVQGPFSILIFRLKLVAITGIPYPPQCVLQMASAPVWRKAIQYYTLFIVCLVLTCLWTRSLFLRAQQQDFKLLTKKLDRIKWLQHRIGCNNIHTPVFPDNWHSINISIHLNILVSSLHP